MAKGHTAKRWISHLLSAALLPVLLLVGCSSLLNRGSSSNNVPTVRVAILLKQTSVLITASQPPIYFTESDPTPRTLKLPPNRPIALTLLPGGWQMGGTMIGNRTLTIQPAVEGSVSIASLDKSESQIPAAYRGQYRFVPSDNGKFEVVNDVDVDGYLAGVLPRELFANWHLETYKAQAITARTYALYEAAAFGRGRNYDVYADQRSQVYGGMAAETDKSRQAAYETAGVVLTYAPSGGSPHIFKAYFSSCCGGVTQSAADAFNDPPIPPLREQNNGSTCSESPHFNWDQITISKVELARRLRAWGAAHKESVAQMDALADARISLVNIFGRPRQFVVVDVRGRSYPFRSEDFRVACNYEAPTRDMPHPATLTSSFFKINVDSQNVYFVEGHGNGHGVGLCQWCSESRAAEGMRHEDIVLAAFPQAKLMRAY
jgi:stage II sporulation protein D